jgi:hypothetical protein
MFGMATFGGAVLGTPAVPPGIPGMPAPSGGIMYGFIIGIM